MRSDCSHNTAKRFTVWKGRAASVGSVLFRLASAFLLIALVGAAASVPPTEAAMNAGPPGGEAEPASTAARPDPEAVSAAAEPLATTTPREFPRDVVISELANGGSGDSRGSFFELTNSGTAAVDLSDWSVYRCNEHGLRRNTGRVEVDLDGVILQPGGIFTAARADADLGEGVRPDRILTNGYPAAGFGLDLVDSTGRRADSVGVYPNEPWPMLSECTAGRNLPNVLDFAAGDSWQRVGDTGDPAADFVLARATPGAPNAAQARPSPSRDSVVIDELTAAGPGGHQDDFVELRNRSAAVIDISGWRLHRCTAAGRLTMDTLQHVVPRGTKLRPGDAYVVGGPGYGGPSDGRAAVSLADATFGALLEASDGTLMDRIAVSEYADSACQDGDGKLPSVLDYPSGESYQRVSSTGDPERDFVAAVRTPGRPNADAEQRIAGPGFTYPARISVAISELANDPAAAALPDGAVQRNYVELANYGAVAVDLSGWSIHRCMVDGRRAFEPQLVIPAGTVLQPDDTFLAARDGTREAGSADARYPVSFNFLGSGIWVQDADGQRIDSMGVYQANEMDRLNDPSSPCTKGDSLVTYRPDRLQGETYQRSRFTGNDHDDFVVAAATPGVLDLHESADPALVDPAALAPVRLKAHPDALLAARPEAPGTGALGTREIGTREIGTGGIGTGAIGAEWTDTGALDGAENVGDAENLGDAVIEAFAGASPDGALRSYRGNDERRIDPSALGRAVAENGWGHPYQRIVLDAGAVQPGDILEWTGATVGRNELTLSVWNPRTGAWRAVDRRTAVEPAQVALRGRIAPSDIDGARITVLVQDTRRNPIAATAEPESGFADPVDYDFAVSHITDTQYLSESYPEVYAEMVAWIVANAPARKIEFVSHTGDLVQNWVDPDQNDARALREYDRASAIQAMLDDSGVPNSVLPGNHDSKRGLDPSLFNGYFGPERYSAKPWYGDSIAPDDNTASYSTFEHGGARFLMLSLPYAYGEREIEWAAGVVEAHDDHNVVVSTHEHVTPKTQTAEAARSDTSRWVSRATALWDRVIAPNRNVVLVLSGHFHGIGRIVTENAGGLPGHTVVELLADYQEFRTHTGERATGFQRLLQLDLASGTISVDTFSARLGPGPSFEYDYAQFTPENGRLRTASNARPWRIVEAGLQHRYSAGDDEFAVQVQFRYPKSVATTGLAVAPATDGTSGWLDGGLAALAPGSR